MPTFYFTYGSKHQTIDGMSLGNYYTEIEAEDDDAAREIMHKARGPKWSMVYSSSEAAGVNKFGLLPAPLDKVTLDSEAEREAILAEVLRIERDNIVKRAQTIEKAAEILRRLPVELIKRATFYGGGIDFDYLNREQSKAALSSLGGGEWKKQLNQSAEGTIDYTAEIDGVPVRLWAAGPPETCRVVEVEEVIPEQRVMRKKLICNPV
jgi:hypothetical protein